MSSTLNERLPDPIQYGGRWLGIMRDFIQRKANNGERVTWGSNEIVTMSVTVDEWEQLAARIAAAAIEQAIQK